MKVLSILCFLLALGACAKKPSKDLLIGKWKDENSIVEYKANGTKISDFDSGRHLEGGWDLVGDTIRFIPPPGSPWIQSDHRIIRLTNDELVIEAVDLKKVYHAKRIPSEAEQDAAANP